MNSTAWDERYASTELVWSAEPNRFLPPEVASLTPGTVLDLACGEGRNAIWLAEQGWAATGVDFSAVAIAKASQLAAERGVSVTWLTADLLEWVPSTTYDLVIVFYLQLVAAERARVLRAAGEAVAPGGGMLLVVAHHLRNLTEGVGGPQSPDVLYTPADVLAAVEGLGFTAERADAVERTVGEQVAIDLLVRARRA
jgi:2-polyprenyl-3-methyl-5-hydroxy-6-metoxy-1,4-benzoquinol methylase